MRAINIVFPCDRSGAATVTILKIWFCSGICVGQFCSRMLKSNWVAVARASPIPDLATLRGKPSREPEDELLPSKNQLGARAANSSDSRISVAPISTMTARWSIGTLTATRWHPFALRNTPSSPASGPPTICTCVPRQSRDRVVQTPRAVNARIAATSLAESGIGVPPKEMIRITPGWWIMRAPTRGSYWQNTWGPNIGLEQRTMLVSPRRHFIMGSKHS